MSLFALLLIFYKIISSIEIGLDVKSTSKKKIFFNPSKNHTWRVLNLTFSLRFDKIAHQSH